MDIYTATEEAYKKGYEQGKKDTVVHGKWIISSDGYYPYCSACKQEPKSGEMTNYCPHCGADMRGGEDD